MQRWADLWSIQTLLLGKCSFLQGSKAMWSPILGYKLTWLGFAPFLCLDKKPKLVESMCFWKHTYMCRTGLRSCWQLWMILLLCDLLMLCTPLSHQRCTDGTVTPVAKWKAPDTVPAVMAYRVSWEPLPLLCRGLTALFTFSASFIHHTLSACVCLSEC